MPLRRRSESDVPAANLAAIQRRARAWERHRLIELIRAEAKDLRDDYWDGVRYAADFIESTFCDPSVDEPAQEGKQ